MAVSGFLGGDPSLVVAVNSALSIVLVVFSLLYPSIAWLCFAFHGVAAVVLASQLMGAVVWSELGPETVWTKVLGYVLVFGEPLFWLVLHGSLVSFIDHWAEIVTLVVAMYVVSAFLIWKSYTGTLQWSDAVGGA
jgi:hypothetical protein